MAGADAADHSFFPPRTLAHNPKIDYDSTRMDSIAVVIIGRRGVRNPHHHQPGRAPHSRIGKEASTSLQSEQAGAMAAGTNTRITTGSDIVRLLQVSKVTWTLAPGPSTTNGK